MKFSGILIVALALVCHVAHSSSCCSPIVSANLFSLKTVNFASTFNAHKYCSSFVLDFPIPSSGLNLGASISDYGTFDFSKEVDFQVYARPQIRNNSVSVILLSDQTFKNLKVSVLASARPDIFIGTFLIDTSMTFDIESTNSSTIVIMGNTFVTPWVPQPSFSFLGLYLSGVRSCCSMPFLCLNVSMDPQTGYMEGYARMNPNAQIQYIQVTYVLSISTQLKFTYQKGVSTAGEINFPVTTCLVNGIPKISTLTIVSDKHPCVGILCPSPYINLDKCNSLNGTIVDGCTCVICEAGMIISNGQCTCAASLYLTHTLTCAKCWANSTITADGLNCKCNANFFLTNVSFCGPESQCFTAVADSVTATCVCSSSQTYFKPGTGCVCIEANRIYDLSSKTCSCNAASYLVNNTCTPCWPNAVSTPDKLDCVCQFGFILVSPKLCNPLPTVNCGSQAAWNGTHCVCTIVDAFFNSTIQTCSCILPLTFNAVYTSCKCPAGSYLLGLQCEMCWLNSFQSSTGYTCNCSTGFELVPGADQCRPLHVCLPPAIYNPLISQCTCRAAQTYSTTKGCICDVNTLIVSPTTGQCVCNSASYGSSGSTCKPCWLNSVSSVSHQTCVCIKGFISVGVNNCASDIPCSVSSQWNSSSQSCQCTIPNMVVTQTGCKCQQNSFLFNKSCICNPISYSIQGICTPSPRNSTPINGTSFICNKGFYLSGQFCLPVPNCLPGAQFSTVTGVCVCIKSTQIYDSAMGCTCPANTRFDMISNQCVCNTNTYLSQGNCVPCWLNSESKSCLTSCDCKPGFYNSGYQTCTPYVTCPGDSQYNPIQMKCVCGIAGQVLISGVCACSAGTTLNITTKLCTCTGNFYLNSNGVCQSCWANSVVSNNGSWCVCVPHFYPATSLSCDSVSPNTCIPPAVNQSGVCYCGNIVLTYVSQVGCACILSNAYFIQNAGICVCNQGYTLIGNACVLSSACISPATNINNACVCPYQNQIYSLALGCTCPQNMIISGSMCTCNFNSIFAPGGNSCVACPTGATADSTYQTCLCKGVAIAITATCSTTQCAGDAVFDSLSRTCKCNPLYFYSPTSGCVCAGDNRNPYPPTQICTCSQGYYFADPIGKTTCKPCWPGSDSSSDRLTCICTNSQYYSTGYSCLPIPTCLQNQIWDRIQQICVCSSALMIFNVNGCVCPTSMTQSGLNCVCNPGLYMVGGGCQTCWQNSYSSNGFCICNAGYTPNGNACVPIGCNAPAISTPNGCQCSNGYIYSNGNCVCNSANMAIFGNSCICVSNTYNSSGVCVSCGSAKANQTGCYCDPPYVLVNQNPPRCTFAATCLINQHLEAGVCVCNVANMISQSGIGCRCGDYSNLGPANTCVCSQGAYRISFNTCRMCWINSIVSTTGDDCTCNLGYIRSGSSCIFLSCIAPATVNTVLSSCVCPDPQQSYRTGFGCECSDRLKEINKVTNKCQCSRPIYYNSNGACLNCWKNSITSNDGTTCDCITNFVSTGFQICTSNITVCGAYSKSDPLTNKCVCIFSFLVLNANNDCSCPNGKILDGLSNTCVCPIDTKINGANCDPCGLNSKSPQNSMSCTCNPGFSLDALGACVSGQQNCISPGFYNQFSSNPSKCDCPNGNTYTLTTGCSSCGANSVLVNNNCICDNFSIPNPSGLGCIRCWAYSYRSGLSCICFANFAPTAPQTCTPKPNCIPGSVWSTTLSQCVCNSTALTYTYQGCVCPPTQIYDNLMKTCGCNYQSILKNGQCIQCPVNAIASSDSLTCICLMGYILQNDQCVAETTCRCGATFNSQSKKCVCSDQNVPYDVYTGCTCNGANQIINYLNLGQCVCDRTSFLSGNQCKKCMDNSAPNTSGNGCVCFPNYVMDAAKQNCILTTACITGATLNSGNVCVCTATYLSYNPLVGCVCPLNLALNAAKTACVCDSHSLILASAPNGCTRCPVGMMADLSKTNCICEIGYYWKNGTCLPIPPCLPEAYFDEENQRCFCFKSASLVNDGCGCVKIFDSITAVSVCSCFLRANPITNYVIEGCSSNVLLINVPSASLTLKDIIVSSYSVVLSMCGIGRISTILLQRQSNWGSSTYKVKVNTSSGLVSTAMTYSGCFTVGALIPSTVMGKLEILLTNSTITTQSLSTPVKDTAVVTGTIYAQNGASIVIK